MALKEISQNQGKRLSELRIVLLGGRNSGKSLVGNAILNQEEFILLERTTCLKRKAEIRGRSLTVVDTPGWWCDFSAQDTPELVRREIKYSVSLSPPGPNVFLLVVKTNSVFTEKRRRAVEEHLKLLGEMVWSHTIVLFTKGKNGWDKSLEDHIRESGQPLQWLIRKCNGRFHFLNAQEMRNTTQVMELMGKIDEMVETKDRRYLEMDVESLQDIEDIKRDVEIKAQQRLMKINNLRSTLKAHSFHYQNIRLVLLGAKGSGKSSTANSILSEGISFTTNQRTTHCTHKTLTVGERQVTVVDTPGWWMNYFIDDSSLFDKEEIVKSVHLCPPGPHACLLVVRADRSFTETYRRAIEEHVELVNKDVWSYSIVLFTFGDWLGDTTIEQYIESEGRALQWLVEKCGNRYHVLNNKSLGNIFQITELLEKTEEMMVGNKVSHLEIDERLFRVIERKRQVEEERANLRRENFLRRRENFRAFKNQVQLPSTVRVILLGAKGSGKTSCASNILGTDRQKSVTKKPIKGTVIFNETKVEVIDMPGWTNDCLDVAKFSTELLKHWLSGSTIGVLLLVVNASSSFTSRKLKAMEKHLRSLGGKVWSNSLVLFTNGDWLGDVGVEQYIESEGDALHALVERCRNRYQVFDNKMTDNDTQVTELMQKIEEMMLEEMINSTANQGNIEGLIINEEMQFNESMQIHKAHASPFRKSTNFLNDDAEIQRQRLMIGTSKPSSTPVDTRITNTDSLLQNQDQALACRSVRLSLPRNVHRRLVVLNPSDWLRTNEPWSIQRLFRNESLEERYLPNFHRNTPHVAQTPKERAFMDFVQSESLQKLIDEWGGSNIEELEAFIDSYFEMVWQEPKCIGMNPMSCECSGITENVRSHLASIDKKLSKLDILEEVQRDLWDLKQSIKHFCRIFQELKDRYKGTPEEETASAESEHSFPELK